MHFIRFQLKIEKDYFVEEELTMAVKKPYNTWARARKVGGKREKSVRQTRIVAIQQWAKGKTDTLVEAPKAK